MDPITAVANREHGGCRCITWTNRNTQANFPLSVMKVFVGHIEKFPVHGDGQHQLLLDLQVPTDLLLSETTKQHSDVLFIEKSASDVTSAFLKS